MSSFNNFAEDECGQVPYVCHFFRLTLQIKEYYHFDIEIDTIHYNNIQCRDMKTQHTILRLLVLFMKL